MSKFVLEILTAVRQVASRARVTRAVLCSAAAPPHARPNSAFTASASCAIGGDSGGVGRVTVALMPPKPPSAEKDLVEGFLEWGTGYALNNLARAQDNDGFAAVVEQLQVGCGGVGCITR